ncbi:hypothetical protein KA405_04070 [Patescibacteria group bacterium]|nr:hypothetical protein [Patescibacteria group bacterium]
MVRRYFCRSDKRNHESDGVFTLFSINACASAIDNAYHNDHSNAHQIPNVLTQITLPSLTNGHPELPPAIRASVFIYVASLNCCVQATTPTVSVIVSAQIHGYQIATTLS